MKFHKRRQKLNKTKRKQTNKTSKQTKTNPS